MKIFCSEWPSACFIHFIDSNTLFITAIPIFVVIVVVVWFYNNVSIWFRNKNQCPTAAAVRPRLLVMCMCSAVDAQVISPNKLDHNVYIAILQLFVFSNTNNILSALLMLQLFWVITVFVGVVVVSIIINANVVLLPLCRCCCWYYC